MGRVIQDPVRGYDVRVEKALNDRMAQLEKRLQAISPIELSPQPTGTVNTLWRRTTTSGSYAVMWYALIQRMSRSALRLWMPWSTALATTGQCFVQLTDISGVVAATSAISLGAGASGDAKWNWVHGIAPWTGVYGVQCLGRRTSGSGVVVFGHPVLHMIESVGCTPTGL